MAILLCSFKGCERKHRALGLCEPHRKQQRRGVPLRPLREHRTVEWRLDSFTNKDGAKGCWLWEGALAKEGYGVMSIGGRTQRVHRVSYTLHMGVIPEGMFIDHTCHVRRCLNPNHLRLATPGENAQNKSGPPSDNTSGYTGVSYIRSSGKFRARITLRGVEHLIGHFDTIEDAWEARKERELELFTHTALKTGMIH